MRFYNQAHAFYCGVDLHARTMYLCIIDHAGTIVLHQEVPAEPGAFLEAVAPYRAGLVVACECLFCWYWLADLCQAENIAFVEDSEALPTAITLNSAGSGSAPWESRGRDHIYAEGVVQATPRAALCNRFAVETRLDAGSQGALRDAGLLPATASR